MTPRNRFRSVFAGGLCVLLAAAAPRAAAQAPADTVPFSLEQAIAYGLDHAVSMRESVRIVAEAEQRKREVIARGLPQVSAMLGYTNYVSLPVSLIPPELAGLPPGEDPIEVTFGVPHNASASAEVSQLVFDGAYFLGVRATKMLVDLEADRTKLNEINLRHNITQAYYTGLIANLRIDAVRRNIGIVDRLLEETRALYDQGFVEQLEVDRLVQARTDLDVLLSSASRERDVAYRMLQYTMNYPQGRPIALTDRLDSLLVVEEVPVNEAFTPEDRLEYRLLQQQEATNEINVRYNRSAFLPKLTAFASYEQQAQRQQFDLFDFDQPWFEIAVVGANLSIPIFDGFYKRSKVEQAKLQLEGIRLQQESLAAGLELEVARARSNAIGSLERLGSLRSSLELARRIYEVTRTKYTEGVGSSLELTTAQRDFQTAEDNYIAGLYDALAARAELIKALGRYPTVVDPR
jgi:outer membrane protein TolC